MLFLLNVGEIHMTPKQESSRKFSGDKNDKINYCEANCLFLAGTYLLEMYGH